MNFSDRKLETAIVVVSFILIMGLGNLLKSPVQNALGLQDVSYEMPRPKASFFAALFELGERAISRTYINPFKDKKNDAKKDAKAAEAAKNTVAQNKKAAQKKAAAAKKPTVEVDVYGEDPNVKFAENDPLADGSQAGAGGAGARTAAKAANGNGSETDDKEKLSVDQWRALVLAQPTPENIAKMVAAFNANELEADGFYSIVADLYKDRRSEVQKMGLMAAGAAYNAMAFAVTAQSYATLNADVQPEAQTYLNSYGASTRLPALAGALRSDSPEVVELAAQIVITAYQKASAGGSNTVGLDPRNSRGDITMLSTSNFSQFVPIFQDLANSNDAEIKNLANTALGQMQNLVAGI